jgi:FkbM family methyltransferase
MRPDAQVTAVEADSENAAMLRLVAAANAGTWRIVEAAATAGDGEVEFDAGAFSLSRLAAAGSPPAGAKRVRVAAVDALELMRDAQLAKVDIEGGEWAILCDDRFPSAAPPALVLEYHPGLCPAADPHALALERLEAAGLEVSPVWRRDDGHGVVWGWKAT